jgi:outer membrane protein assembly factor BamB
MQIFFPEGDFIRGFHVTAQHDWQGPFGFSINDGGKIFLPDPAGSRIEILDSHGKLDASWKFPPSATGKAGHPSIAVVGDDGSVYAGEWDTGRIVKYSSDGRQVNDWGPAVGSSAPLLSLGVSSKYVFALRDAVPHLQVWTLDGHLKMTDNLGGLLDGTSPSKASLAAGYQDDLIVLDPSAPRVLRFRTHLDLP